MYEQEIQALQIQEKDVDLTLVQHRRTLYTEKQIEELRQKFVGIPETYLAYLTEVGEGSFRDEYLTIFGELLELEDFFDEALHEFIDDSERMLLFGCDYAGNGLVFLVEEGWQVGILYQDDLGEVEWTDQDFKTYISEIILDQ